MPSWSFTGAARRRLRISLRWVRLIVKGSALPRLRCGNDRFQLILGESAEGAILGEKRLARQCGQRILRLLKQVLPSVWVLPVMAVPSNLPHLAGVLSPRLLNAGSDNVRHAT
jgi:hypothetical protein